MCIEKFFLLQIAQIAREGLEGNYRIPDSPKVSNESKGLIEKCLQPNPQQRGPLATILKHPWFPSGLSSKVKLSPNCERSDCRDYTIPNSYIFFIIR